MTRIYLDHAATSPLVDNARQEMIRVMDEVHGNPSSTHLEGRKARTVLEQYRVELADLVGATPNEVIFTSGATESDNIALTACGNHLVTSRAEHKAVLEPAGHVASKTSFLSPAEDGVVELQDADLVSDGGGLVSLMWVNNETGALTDVHAAASLAKTKGYLFHTDAVQAFKWMPIDFDSSGLDMVSLSAHKIGGPKGIGVLLKKPWVSISPVSKGGGQERGLRPGTENLVGVAGLFGAMAAIQQQNDMKGVLNHLSSKFYEYLKAELGDRVRRNGPTHPDKRAPHILNMTFFSADGIPMDAGILLHQLDRAGIACSSGSACTSGAIEPSHVLTAMGINREEAAASLRFSFSDSLTERQVFDAASRIVEILKPE